MEEITKEDLSDCFDSLRDLIYMRQTPNEAYSSDQMDYMIMDVIKDISSFESPENYVAYQRGMIDMYNVMKKFIITSEP